MGNVVFKNPPFFNAAVCRQGCATFQKRCQSACTNVRNTCLARVGTRGGQLASHCIQQFDGCESGCATSGETCEANCQPQDGCPAVMSSDGGVFFNTFGESPACQTPNWLQPDVTPRGLWLFALDGANIPASLTDEAVYMGAQDNGTFGTLTAGAATPAWTNSACCDSTDVAPDASQVVFTVCCFFYATPSPTPSPTPPRNQIFRAGPGLSGGAQIPNYPPGDVPRGSFPDVIARFDTNHYAVITTAGIFFTLDITANPITWTALGNNAPTAACALWAAGPPTSPSFYAMTGFCDGGSGSGLLRYDGTSSTGAWQTVNLPSGASSVGVFTADRNNANRIFLSAFTTGWHMFRSTDGGLTGSRISPSTA